MKIIDENKTTNNKTGFKLPDAYFDTFEIKLKAQLGTAKRKQQKLIRLVSSLVAVAAIALLVFVVYKPVEQESPLEVADIEAWIDEGNMDLSTYEIALLLEEEDLEIE
jgi:hypothetical protein